MVILLLLLYCFCGLFVWLCIYLPSGGFCLFVRLTRTSQLFNSTATCILYSRVDPEVQGVIYRNEETPGARWLLHGWLRQTKRRGTTFVSTAHTPPLSVPSHVSFCSTSPWQEAEKKKEEAEKQQEDEEGWTKVTKGPKGAKARPHSEAANRRTLQKEMKKKKRKELLNFYSWQHKNTQKERKWYFFIFYLFFLIPKMTIETEVFFFLTRYCWTKEKVWRG